MEELFLVRFLPTSSLFSLPGWWQRENLSAMKQRSCVSIFFDRTNSRYRHCRLLLTCRHGSDPDRGADKSQCHFPNRCHEYHGLVIADMRATTCSDIPAVSTFTFGTAKTLYFDSAGQFTTIVENCELATVSTEGNVSNESTRTELCRYYESLGQHQSIRQQLRHPDQSKCLPRSIGINRWLITNLLLSARLSPAMWIGLSPSR